MLSKGMSASSDLPLMGSRCRALRRARALTLDQIAALSGLSKGHLSRFERGEKTLSVAALLRLAKVLDCPVGALMGDEILESDIHVSRQRDRTPVTAPLEDGDYSYELLSPQRDHAPVMLRLILRPRSQRRGAAHHGGREAVFVVSGRVILTLAGTLHELHPGDCVDFAAHLQHELAAAEGEAESVVIVTIYPS